MTWPFSKTSPKTRLLTRRLVDETFDAFYVSRPRIEKSIADILAHGDNLVIYGPPHQGKTKLLTRQLAAADSVVIECSPGFKRTQIYRVALSSLGYALLVEKTKKGKASATVKLGIASLGLGAEATAEEEMDQVMHSVTVDLKNPSEVAHLISRMKHLPWLVLDNFQLLDNGTKSNLLFDLSFFAERPGIRIIVVGDWSQDDYLEEIEPAVAGKFKHVFVPPWSVGELREAATQWSAHSNAVSAVMPHLDEFVTLAGGDISLFRALVEGCIDSSRSASSRTTAAPVLSPQAMVIGRFRRGLTTRLKAIFDEREIYVKYYALETSTDFAVNPSFRPIRNAVETDYRRTTIDPLTNQPYPDGRAMLLDRDGHTQYIEQITGTVVEKQAEVVSFLLRKFHNAVQQGSSKIDLASLAHEFGEQLRPRPIALDESRLREIFVKFDEVQRQALIVPNMLAVVGNTMQIVDRRLFLFLQSVSLEDLEDLLDNVQPRTTPKVRRRNRLSPEWTDADKAAYIAKVLPQIQEAVSSNGTAEVASNEPEESLEDGSRLPKTEIKAARPRKQSKPSAA